MNAKVVRIALLAAAAGAGLTFVLVEGGDRESRRPERAAVDLQRRVEAAEAERAQARAELARLRRARDPQADSRSATERAAEWARGQVIKLAATERDDEVRAVLHAALLAYSPPVTGALVIGVDSAGDGEKAGLRVGDIITRYGGRAVRDHHDLWDEFQARQLETHPIAVALLRDGRELTLPVAPGWLGLTMRTLETR
ncbi:MAG: PDZ domain-containing protein [Planctomycetota bacterium]|nr:PDZ domain-containing protein [Planctomycetota bacterium]